MAREKTQHFRDLAADAACSLGVGSVVVSLVVLLFLGACGGVSTRDEQRGPGPVPAVEAVPARVGSLPLEEQLSGVTRARNQVAIRPEISGTVVEVFVRNGEAVTAGQPLARLDDEALQEQARRAAAELRLAEATAAEARARVQEVQARVVRTRALAADGLASQLDLETLEAQLDATQAEADQSEAQVEQARASVQERRSALAKATIRAPVQGHAGQRDVEVGMVVGPSSTLFVVGDVEDLIVEVPLTQEMLRDVEVGSAVEIEARELEQEPLRAEISRISPFLETESFSTTAEIDLPSGAEGLRPGMFVTVRVLYGASDRATLVPASAIWEDPLTGDLIVFVVEDATGLTEPAAHGDEIPEQPRRLLMRPVEVLGEGRGTVGVRGVAEGEWVVTLGQHLLHESLEATDSEVVEARVRPTTWAHVLELAGLQREDLLEQFLAKQRVVARSLGAELPESTARVDEVMRAATDSDAGSPTRFPRGGS
jgi:RND family efflux transporter MFP subunit